MWHETPVLIRYADTDQMGVVHHAVYPVYCEIGRTDLLESQGLPYAAMEAAGIYLMVADMSCRFKAPARYGESLVVRTRIEKLRPKLLAFGYEIGRAGQDRILFSGVTTHLFCDETRGAMRCPEPFWGELQTFFAKRQSA